MAGRATKRNAEKPTARKPSKSSTRKARAAQSAAGPSVYTVFISHSSKDNWIAGQISKEIKALGAETWVDIKDLRGGDEIRRSIKRKIRASQEVIVLLSVNSITSQWVSYEAGIAYDQGRRVTPILHNLAPSQTLAPLRDIKPIDLNDLDDFLVELTGRIKGRLSKTRKASI
jgi:hypothetical protein